MNNINIIDVSEVDFNEKIIEASQNKLIVVDFWAPWCGPCKQLTPLLEKVATKASDKIVLAKINIDDNQQIAAQLRIQSIPAVFAFKNKQIVDAFQGVIGEKDIIHFIEKALGEKLEQDFTFFYESVQKLLKEKNFDEAKNALLEFISQNTNDIKAICYYLECLIEKNELDEANEFLKSIDDEIQKDSEIIKVIKKLDIINKNISGPSEEILIKKLNESPNNIDIIFDLADNYFSNKKYDEALALLLEQYPKKNEKVKKKMIVFFEALGNTHDTTILYRKKLSSILFS